MKFLMKIKNFLYLRGATLSTPNLQKKSDQIYKLKFLLIQFSEIAICNFNKALVVIKIFASFYTIREFLYPRFLTTSPLWRKNCNRKLTLFPKGVKPKTIIELQKTVKMILNLSKTK